VADELDTHSVEGLARRRAALSGTVLVMLIVASVCVGTRSRPGLVIGVLVAVVAGLIAILQGRGLRPRSEAGPSVLPSYSVQSSAGRLFGLSATRERSADVLAWKSAGCVGIHVVESMKRSRPAAGVDQV
jgi:hypothetical protein